jgi:EAL domain-containing protein (putative c-di-GMP-specific phosphodiesterase class I)
MGSTMNATEPQILGATDRTAELLRELADCDGDAAATRLALERASDAVGAELCVYADGDLLEGACSEASLLVPVHGRLRGHLVLARSDRQFDDAEREETLAIARALSLYEPGPDAELLERLALQDELPAALRRNEIQVHFLPKVELATARVTGIEALARWLHPKRGLLLPADFIGLAESGGLISVLTERVLQLASRAAGDWWRSGLELELSVNLPADALADPTRRLERAVTAALSQSRLPAEALRFDVTEDAVMGASDPAGALQGIRDLGASISIDDFGTGHTALGRLKRLAVDELKIDRSFIRAVARGGDKALVRSTVHLARQMGLRVVAEGVDTEGVWRLLRGMGCDAAQGFLIGAPMPAREFLAWIASWDARGRKLNSQRPPGRPPRSEGRSPERLRRAAARGRDLMAKP